MKIVNEIFFFCFQFQKNYGKSQVELIEFCKTLSEVAYVQEKGEVTCEEWLNWIKLDQSEDTKSQTKNFIKTHSEFREWEKLFFKLSNGSMEINTTELEKYIKDTEDAKVTRILDLKTYFYLKNLMR